MFGVALGSAPGLAKQPVEPRVCTGHATYRGATGWGGWGREACTCGKRRWRNRRQVTPEDRSKIWAATQIWKRQDNSNPIALALIAGSIQVSPASSLVVVLGGTLFLATFLQVTAELLKLALLRLRLSAEVGDRRL